MDGENIDLIDVIGFFWRGKKWALIGIIFSLLTAFGLLSTKMSPTYVTSIPLKIISGTQDWSAAEIRQMFALPEVKDFLAARNSEHLASSDLMSQNFPLIFVQSGSKVILEISAKSSDSSGLRALEFSKDLNLAIEELKKKASKKKSELQFVEASGAKPEVVSAYVKLVTKQVEEAAPYRIELFAMEARLSQKMGVPPIQVGSSDPRDAVLRLLGDRDAKITKAERQKILLQYAALVAHLSAIHAFYEQPLREFASQFALHSADILAFVGVEPPGTTIHNFVVDEVAFHASVAVGAHERNETKRGLVIPLAMILGALFGIMGYGIKLFFEKNYDRLQAALSSK